MEIKVFGPGCARCSETYALMQEVAETKGNGISVQKISDPKEMMLAGVMSTPAVVINGVIRSSGRVPDREEVAAWIDGACK